MRMRCCGRFGKGFLRAGLGRRHLTEGRWLERRRDGAPSTTPAEEPEHDEAKADRPERHQEVPPRAVPSRLRGRGLCRHHGGAGMLDGHGTSLLRLRSPLSIDAIPRGPVLGPRHRGTRSRPQNGVVPDARRTPRRSSRSRPRPDALRGRCRSIGTAARLHPRVSVQRSRAGGRGCTLHRRDRSSLHRRRLLRRRLNGRRLRGLARRRQERQRVDVTVRIRRVADAQVDVRLGPFGIAARADRADDVSFGDLRSDGHADRAEVDERDRPAVGGPNR